MAQGKKTGGRQKGTPNKVTAKMREEMAESGETPLEYMIRGMRDEESDQPRRDEMAKAAAPYLHARLSSIEQTGELDVRQHIISDRPMSDDEWERQYCVVPATGAAEGTD